MTGPRALVLTGDVGMGHHVVTEVVADSLTQMGWATDVLDCMALLGRNEARAGNWLFRRFMAAPALYDAAHFAHFRTGSRLATAMDRAATTRLVPALTAHLDRAPVDVVISTFATGSSAIAQLPRTAGGAGRPVTVALCNDVCPHSLWVHEDLDLFLVTSGAAAAGVRRHSPRTPTAVVPPPVRATFHHAPSQADARDALGIGRGARCALVMGGGWGLGPLAETAEALAARGVVVLAVAGHNARQEEALGRVARRQPGVVPFGFTDEVPALMAASDLVVTTPGASTCSEARVVGRPLMLLDVMPGHGRDNVQHELELGEADVCDPHPRRLVDCVLGALERALGSDARMAARLPMPDRFTGELARALTTLGLRPRRVPAPGSAADRAPSATTLAQQEVH